MLIKMLSKTLIYKGFRLVLEGEKSIEILIKHTREKCQSLIK